MTVSQQTPIQAVPKSENAKTDFPFGISPLPAFAISPANPGRSS
jgi:hypothetical protein